MRPPLASAPAHTMPLDGPTVEAVGWKLAEPFRFRSDAWSSALALLAEGTALKPGHSGASILSSPEGAAVTETNNPRERRPGRGLPYLVAAIILVVIVVLALRSCSTEDNRGPPDTVLSSARAAALAPPTNPGDAPLADETEAASPAHSATPR